VSVKESIGPLGCIKTNLPHQPSSTRLPDVEVTDYYYGAAARKSWIIFETYAYGYNSHAGVNECVS